MYKSISVRHSAVLFMYNLTLYVFHKTFLKVGSK